MKLRYRNDDVEDKHTFKADGKAIIKVLASEVNQNNVRQVQA